METNLAIDVGNTRTKIALFEGSSLVRREIWDSLELGPAQALAYNQNVKKVIFSSVAEVPAAVADFFSSNFFCLHLSTQTPLPIEIQYQTPHTLGKDRIAAAVGAYFLFPGENCLVIDAGTCITMDVLDSSGVFRGGNISPGIEMRLRAMHHFTARLPLVKHNRDGHDLYENALGNSTENAIRNGGELGALLEMEAFIQAMGGRYKDLKVVLTGGDTDFFGRNLKTKIFAHPNLVLIGLNQILQHNAKLSEGI
jgi:type III pantothenate kinase